MCGRYQLHTPVAILQQAFRFSQRPNLEPRYNIAPTQSVPIVRRTTGDELELAMVRWGLVPFWAKELSVGARMINARAERVATAPSFRAAFKARRCLVPADGFYEWRKVEDAKRKQPYVIRRRDRQPFAFAGLWESWKGPDGPVETCTIITTQANATLASLHERMPVILEAADHERWLDPGKPAAADLLKPAADDLLEVFPVSTRVNYVANEGADLIEPINPA